MQYCDTVDKVRGIEDSLSTNQHQAEPSQCTLSSQHVNLESTRGSVNLCQG